MNRNADLLSKGYRYRRVLLKLSGEAVSGRGNGEDAGIIDFPLLDRIAQTLTRLAGDGLEIAVIFGAGNIWRGRSGGGMDRVTADRMGMLATVINCLAGMDAVRRAGGKAVLFTSTPMMPYGEYYSTDRAKAALAGGNVVFFGGGTGSPYFSTDTAGILRAAEIGADVFLLAKNIDGIYSGDPRKDSSAVRYEKITYSDMMKKQLKGIDLTASAFGADFGPEAFAFLLSDPEDIVKAVRGGCAGTVITK
ncbi:MAG: uridine monophosphate kinase [Clostridia bacterium]|nr:uridine monophosphate kinase [Clostridia bacterium]